MDILVKQSNKFNVEVFAWEDKDKILATYIKKDVPDNTKDVKVVTFTCRKPSYGDSNVIIKQAGARSDSIDIVGFKLGVLQQLVVDWDIVGEDGEKDEYRATKLGMLEPAIASAATAGILEKVNLY